MRILLYMGMLAAAALCGRAPAQTQSQIQPQTQPPIQTGDLLFLAGGGGDMSRAIVTATGGRMNFTHVGIAIIRDGADSVLEAATDGGVRIAALARFLDGAAPVGETGRSVVAMRLRDTAGTAAAVARARTFVGQPYDYSYMPGNGKMYCSELVWESYRTADGEPVFTSRPMNFRAPDGTMPQFWIDLFETLGEPIPEGVEGTNPNDMSQDEALCEVFRWF